MHKVMTIVDSGPRIDELNGCFCVLKGVKGRAKRGFNKTLSLKVSEIIT